MANTISDQDASHPSREDRMHFRYHNNNSVFLPTRTEEREVLGAGSIPIAILRFPLVSI